MQHTKAAEFLASHPFLRTGDLDEARHCVTEKFCDHRLFVTSKQDHLSVCHNHVAGKYVSVNYLHYGAQVQIDPGMLEDFYLLQVPLSGSALIRHRGKDCIANSDTATVLNPDRETDMTWHGDCRKLLLQIDKTYLHEKAQELLGAPVPGTIRFDPLMDLRREEGHVIRKMVVLTARLAEFGALFSGMNTARDQRAEADLVTKLLTMQNSNISHMLAKADHKAMPAGIKRAMAYIHANLSEPIRLGDIAHHAGMNVRTLQKGFQRALDLTPMQALHSARLDCAHYQLTVRRNKPSVTDVAYSNGFSHLGRFSRDYKERFGHSPSQAH
ncbi:MAG: AraC family transcriptional regulator [Aliishimia sp.]